MIKMGHIEVPNKTQCKKIIKKLLRDNTENLKNLKPEQIFVIKSPNAEVVRDFLSHHYSWCSKYNDYQMLQQYREDGAWNVLIRKDINDPLPILFGLNQTCIYAFDKNPRLTKYKLVLRNTISETISEFKKKMFLCGEVFDPYTKQEIFKNDCHVDHAEIPFCEIVDKFIQYLAEHSINITDLEYEIDNTFNYDVLSGIDKKLWVGFHDSLATLQILSAKSNLSKGNRKAPKGYVNEQ